MSPSLLGGIELRIKLASFVEKIKENEKSGQRSYDYVKTRQQNRKKIYERKNLVEVNMSRVKAGVITRTRHKKIIKRAKGYYGRRKNTFKAANQAVEKAGQYAYRDRKVRKREFRSLWIQRINAGCRLHGIKYSIFINGLKKLNLNFNRKILADLAAQEPNSFSEIVEKVKAG